MNKKGWHLRTICCIAAMIVGSIMCVGGTSLKAATVSETSVKRSAFVEVATSESQESSDEDDGVSSETSGVDESSTTDEANIENADGESDEDDLVIVEVKDTETPAANVQVAEDQPSYLWLVATLAAAVAVLVVLLILLQVKYSRLRQQTRRLEDEIAQLYAKNVD